MRSVSAARMDPLRDTGVLIRDEPTTITEPRKAVAQTVACTTLEHSFGSWPGSRLQPTRWPFLQERQHALACLGGDEQPGRLLGQLLGMAVEAGQDRRRGQRLRRGQAL